MRETLIGYVFWRTDAHTIGPIRGRKLYILPQACAVNVTKLTYETMS